MNPIVSFTVCHGENKLLMIRRADGTIRTYKPSKEWFDTFTLVAVIGIRGWTHSYPYPGLDDRNGMYRFAEWHRRK